MIYGILTALLLLGLAIWLGSQLRIRRFRRVRPDLWRGGQPSGLGLWYLAKVRGVRTVVNLRADRVMDENRFGLRECPLPLPPRTNVPTLDQVRELLALLDQAEHAPFFVHCKVGADRTGFMIACIRILRDGWTYEQAVAEWEGVKGESAPDESKALLRAFIDTLQASAEAR